DELIALQSKRLTDRAGGDEAFDGIQNGASNCTATSTQLNQVRLRQIGPDLGRYPQHIVGLDLVVARCLSKCALGEELDDLLWRGRSQVDIRATGTAAQVQLDRIAVVLQTLA